MLVLLQAPPVARSVRLEGGKPPNQQKERAAADACSKTREFSRAYGPRRGRSATPPSRRGDPQRVAKGLGVAARAKKA